MSEVFNLYPDYKVFIVGQDISALVSSITVEWSLNSTSPARLNLTVQNPREIFTLTEKNLTGSKVFRQSSDPFDNEFIKESIYKVKTSLNRRSVRVILPPASNENYAPSAPYPDGSSTSGSLGRRWPLRIGDSIFNTMDPIRVFFKDPHFPTNERWMYAFAGFLTGVTESVSGENSASSLRVTASDVSYLLKLSRIITNPILGMEYARIEASSGAPLDVDFSDHGDFTYKTNLLFGSRDLISLTKNLITGGTLGTRITGSAEGTATTELSIKGVGRFRSGREETFTGARRQMEKWHARTLGLFGQGDELFLTEAQVLEIGRTSDFSGRNAPGRGELLILKPREGSVSFQNFEIDNLPKSFENDITTRLDILAHFCEMLFYKFYATPKGDIVLEFPQHSFVAEDYGKYASTFVIDSTLQDYSLTEDDGEVVNYLLATGATIPGQENNELTPINTLIRYHAQSISRFGVRTRQVKNLLIKKEALKGYSEFMMRQLSASVRSIDITTTFSPFMWINRPIEVLFRKKSGLAESIIHTINWNQDATTSVGLDFIRDVDETTGRYHSLFGEDKVFNYSLFSGRGDENPLATIARRPGGRQTEN